MKSESSGRGAWINALLLFLSLCVAVALSEALIRLFVPVREVGSLFTVNDPIMDRRIKKNFHTVRVTPEFTMTFTSNSLGYRGPEPIPSIAKPVLFLGDSFTMGYGVNDGEEYPAMIKGRFDNVYGENSIGVVNAGIGNSGNGRWVKFLRSEVDQFDPRLVVLQVTANDFEDNIREAYFSVSENGTLNELPIKVSKAKSLNRILDAIPGLSNSYLYSLARQAIDRAYIGSAAKPSSTVQDDGYADRLTARLIAEAVMICQKKGYPMFAILVGLEGRQRFVRVKAIFQSQQVPIYVAPTKKERPDLYYKIDGHWNSGGHAFIAQAVFDQLQSLNFIPNP